MILHFIIGLLIGTFILGWFMSGRQKLMFIVLEDKWEDMDPIEKFLISVLSFVAGAVWPLLFFVGFMYLLSMFFSKLLKPKNYDKKQS